jgi:hypothetical protein
MGHEYIPAPRTLACHLVWLGLCLILCAAAAPSTSSAAIVIENNNFAGNSFTGTGPLRIKLTEAIGERSNRIECTNSTLSGTVTSPIPDSHANITSWTMTGCTAYNGSVPYPGTAPTQVLNLASLPPIEAVSKNLVTFKKPASGTVKVHTEYFKGGSLCEATVELSTTGYNYTSGASANQLSTLQWEFYTTPSFDPNECLNGGTAEFEPKYSFQDPQFEVVERNYQPPTIQTRPASSSTKTDATLTGAIAPNGLPTQYHFEYGLTSSYGTKVPVPDGSLSANLSTTQLVSRTLTGLQSGTTYYYRLVASNAMGTTPGPPQTFTTPSLWTTIPSPNPEGSSANRLESVSCEPSSTNMCMSVGKSTVAGTEKVLAERWNGSSWALSAPLVPSGATASSLNGVACPTTTSCRAVGTYKTSAGTFSLAEHWNGTAWTIVPTENGAGASSTVLTELSCTSANVCTAVGYAITGGVATPVAESWNGTSWSMQTVPLPPNSTGSVLESVSCQGTGFCMAVGRYTETGGQQVRPFSVAWNGSNWSMKTVPDPEASWKDELLDVDCTSTALCTAAGVSIVSGAGGGWLTLLVRWNGTAWVTQTSPNPPSSGVFWGVDCVNASSNPCNAVGWWTIGTPTPAGTTGFTLASRWNGTAWALESTPNPSGSKTNILLDVSCRVTTCVATGSSTNAAGASTTLAQQR